MHWNEKMAPKSHETVCLLNEKGGKLHNEYFLLVFIKLLSMQKCFEFYIK
jgi:hypothetical protein